MTKSQKGKHECLTSQPFGDLTNKTSRQADTHIKSIVMKLTRHLCRIIDAHHKASIGTSPFLAYMQAQPTFRYGGHVLHMVVMC